MTYRIFKFLKEYSFDPFTVDRLIISTYLSLNSIQVENNLLLKSYEINNEFANERKALQTFSDIILKEQKSLHTEDLIQLFEFVISPAEKEVNGAVYTPEYIRKYIVQETLSHLKKDTIPHLIYGDISCGCGGFFYTLTLLLRERYHLSFEEIYKNNIFGVDIQQYSITRTRLLLSLLAIINGEDKERFQFNLYCANSLNFDFAGIDIIKK